MMGSKVKKVNPISTPENKLLLFFPQLSHLLCSQFVIGMKEYGHEPNIRGARI